MQPTPVHTARLFRVLGFITVFFVAVLSACDDDTGSVGGGPCQRHSDCLEGEFCDETTLTCTPGDGTTPLDDVSDATPDTINIWREDTATQEDTEDPDTDTGPAACEEGEVRECGIDVGECTIGEEICVDGQWAECSGVTPVDEECDGLDNDCDLEIDENIVRPCGINQGVCISGVQGCLEGGEWAPCKGSIEPSDEYCDGLDNNCDLEIDETGIDAPLWYQDLDGDGFGDANTSQASCAKPDGYVADNTDCDDSLTTGPITYPGAPELCDDLDNDCNGFVDDGTAAAPTWYQDLDGDNFGNPAVPQQACDQPTGYVADDTDCDDAPTTGPTTYPTAPELCDERDNNCNTQIDEDVQTIFYRDADGDSFGNPTDTVLACSAPPGYVADNTDCDDNPTTGAINYPTAPELCDDIDNNCNTQIDEGALLTFYRDVDGDLFGDLTNTAQACAAPTGYVTNSTDCDDTRDISYPGATEICDGRDNNCDTFIDEGVKLTFFRDEDQDGFGTTTSTTQACSPPPGFVVDNTDCEDTNSTIYPGAPEQCDGISNDCDAEIDEDITDVTFYRDADGDNYGDPSVTALDCLQPSGYVTNNTDCNDNPATSGAVMFPNNPEVCDTLDNDCDTQIDEGVKDTFYADTDGDGYGNNAVSTQACTAPPNYVTNNTDCNDNASTGGFLMNPGRTEVCDTYDNDCDTQIDEGVKNTYYADADSDTFGNLSVSTQACTAPAGYVTNSTDCNDANNAIRPNATEVCDTLDNDCDTQIDEGVKTTFYADLDGDTFGNAASSTQACTAPANYVTNNTDCNDNPATSGAVMYPGRTEVCDTLDNDCDTQIDEGVKTTYYRDADGDTYGNLTNTTQACTLPAGYVTNSTDCNDANSAIKPGATEVCDTLDNNCNTQIDEGVKTTFYRDADVDGYGNASISQDACSAPNGYVANSTDCNDANTDVNPGHAEVCPPNNTIDDNCNGQINENCTCIADDTDADGSNQCCPPQTTGCDCDDTNGGIRPGATERCDGLDNDCDGRIDEDFDIDNDTYSVCSTDPLVRDCDDSATTGPTTYPGAPELCDTRDNNCNGYIDEGCSPCNSNDTDGDGVSECAGDCNPSNGLVYPGASDLCDGIDNDCNRYTVENCDVSQPCNFASGADVCKDDLLCACLLNASGSCTGNYRCTSLCNTSANGALGDGCAANQACSLDLTNSANVHGCDVKTTTPGTKRGGEPCASASECRSLLCEKLCVGSGCNQTFCIDYCGSDDYCPASNTTCRVQSFSMDGRCWPTNAGTPTTTYLGSSTVGTSCTTDRNCDHGLCLTANAAVPTAPYCTEACCEDSDCPGGYTCSLKGNQIAPAQNYVYPADISCATNAQCAGYGGTCTAGKCTGCTTANQATTCDSKLCYAPGGGVPNRCAWIVRETSPVCVKDVSSQGSRFAGQACTTNNQCASNFCERTLGVCVDVCCADSSCPAGLTCELQFVETILNSSSPQQLQGTSARVCLNQSVDFILRPK